MVVNGFWNSKKLSSLPYHPWMCLGSRCHHHHPCHQMVWVGKDFKGSISFSERQWQFVGTSCPRPAEVEATYDQVTPPSPLAQSLQCFGQWKWNWFFMMGRQLFWRGSVPLPYHCFLVPRPIIPVLQTAVHTGYASPACLFPNLDKCVASWAVSNLLCKLSAEKALAAQSVTDPQGHPGRRFWEAAETSELLTLLTSQQEQQYPLLFQGWKPLDLDAQCTLAFP